MAGTDLGSGNVDAVPVERKVDSRMKPNSFLLAVALLAVSVRLAPAQNYAPPPSKPPDEATLKVIADKTARLGSLLNSLRRQDIRDPYLSDIEIYHKAALWIARHNEFYQAEAGDWTLDALDRGTLRARQLGQGEAPWYQRTGQTVIHVHRSRIDGSVQP